MSNQSTIPEAPQQRDLPETMSKKPFRGKRGNTSSKNRKDQHRNTKNSEFMADLTKQLRERLFLDDEETIKFAEAFFSKSTGNQGAKTVPITSRAVGFHAQQFTEKVQSRNYHELPQLLAAQYYRGSLVMLNNTCSKIRSPAVLPGVNAINPPAKIPIQEDRKFLLGIGMASIITSVGNTTVAGDTYAPFIPDLLHTTIAATADAPSTSRPSKRARTGEPAERAGYRQVSLVNPYFVTARNLRETVELLSNPAYPAVTRTEFRQRNPLPGAQWSEDDVLLNPDEICPAGWLTPGDDTHRNDLSAIKNYMAYVQARDPSLVAECTIGPEGTPSFLTTALTTGPFALGHTVICPRETSFYILTAEIKNNLHKITGASDLLGEVPRFSRSARFDHPEAYQVRSANVQHSNYAINWTTLSLSGDNY